MYIICSNVHNMYKYFICTYKIYIYIYIILLVLYILQINIYIYIFICIYVCMYMYIYIYICIYIYIYIHKICLHRRCRLDSSRMSLRINVLRHKSKACKCNYKSYLKIRKFLDRNISVPNLRANNVIYGSQFPAKLLQCYEESKKLRDTIWRKSKMFLAKGTAHPPKRACRFYVLRFRHFPTSHRAQLRLIPQIAKEKGKGKGKKEKKENQRKKR